MGTGPLPTAVIDEVIAALAFDAQGLVPAIAQQYDTGEVLMMAWMDAAAVRATLETANVHYYSRSRRKQWRKGETSGHTQRLVDFRYDCDHDAVLVLVDQTGPACHTGRRNCFFHDVTAEGIREDEAPAASPASGGSSER